MGKEATLVEFGKKKVQVPQSWNDLPLRDVLYCYEVIMQDAGEWIGPAELLPHKKILLARRLLNMSSTYMEQWEQDRIQEHGLHDGQLVFIAELDQVLSTVNFLFEPQGEDNEVSIALTYTNIPYPYLESQKRGKNGKRTRLYGPKNALENITLFELGYTFQTFEKFIETQEEQWADHLIAALYRPQKPMTQENRRTAYYGDIRMPLYRLEHMIEKRQELTKTLPAIVKRIILFWFASCRKQIIQEYENIFQSNKDKPGRHVGNDYGWGGILLGLAGGLADLDQIANRPYQDGLVNLSYLEDQRKSMEMWGHK